MIKCGLLGLPNVGKSTIFNALTNSQIAASNYPFCTIEPNKANVPVQDERLKSIAQISLSKTIIPTHIEFIDIAGLVKGASQGEGLGNKFLEHLRVTNAIGHVVRCFDDINITHVDGTLNPIQDIETITTELILADIATLEKLLKVYKNTRSTNNDKTLYNLYMYALDHLNEGKELLSLKEDSILDFQLLEKLHLLTTKPMFFIANVDSYETSHNKYLSQVLQVASLKKVPVVVVQAVSEYEISQLKTVQDKKDILDLLGLQDTVLSKLINISYQTLNLVTYFTTSEKETRAWTIPQNTKAPIAASYIHSDFEKHFIRAKVVKFKDFISSQGLLGATQAGQLRTEGKEYIVEDGDIIHWLVSC